jgi:hypothetical protein
VTGPKDLVEVAKALAEPGTKFIEAIDRHLGLVLEPGHIRRKAKAEVDAAKIKAEGDLELLDFEDRIIRRREYLEERRQQNREAIAREAVNQLPNVVSDEKVEEDWLVQFFNYAQDVSNEEMQLIWARLLAGEVAQPGTYSLRTLNLVRLLRQEDAILFSNFCSYLSSGSTHVYTKETFDYLRERGLYFDRLLHIQALGLLSVDGTVKLVIPPKESLTFEYFDRSITLKSKDLLRRGLHYYPLTDVGAELASLCDVEPDYGYLDALVDSLPEWFDVEVS